ncbi:hypothetical protein [Nitrosophilus alvini]|uniref:hypothetical protein n=1 Tax=Nitrosophilus alvini TaxID=2714855 RepID=UPI001F15EE74|nr:hypothetical protein [Nitrosophilus alvini]
MIGNSEKKELLSGFEETKESYQNLDAKFLITVLLAMVIVFAFSFPKIYLRNHIYYKSRDLNRLLRQYDSLKEENRLLRQQLESLKFKNQILDTMF